MYLHTAAGRRVQLGRQHWSESSVPSNPASHCSFPSTRKFPQKDSSGSEKQRSDFVSKTFRIDLRLQGENFCKLQKSWVVFIS